MNNTIRKISATVLSLSMLALSVAVVPQKADAAVSSWQKGASMVSRYAQDFGGDPFKQSVNNLKLTGANYVSLIIPYYQSNTGSTDIQSGWNTPSDQSLIAAINYIHSQGMKVMLKPHLESYDGQWRAYINPGDRDTWFKNYGTMLNHLGDIGKQTGVEDICVGTELISMSSQVANGNNATRWQSLIGDLRTHYSGRLTYSANWGPADNGFVNEKDNIGFWGSLDYVGLSAYFNLQAGSTDYNAMKSAWDQYQGQVAALANRTGKQVVFTEVGYRSTPWAHTQPWDYNMNNGASEKEQSDSYDAMFRYWNDYGYMNGVQLWYWSTDPNAGGPNDTDYIPQHKAAEGIMKGWFGGGMPNPNPTSTPTTTPTTGNTSVNGNFTATGSVSPAQPGVNQAATLSPAVTINGTASNVIVDVEVYNSSNNQVFQKFFDGESFTSNQTKNYTASWTPSQTGNYKLVVGVFNNNWTQNYLWSEVSNFTVGNTSSGGTGTTTSTSTTPTGNPASNYTVSATMNPTTATVGQSATIMPSVTTNGYLSNAVVDVEVYNSSNTRVLQQFFEGQNFNANEAKSFNVAWNPSAAGNYTLKLGLFSGNWSQNYYWNDAVTTLAVQSSMGGNTGGSTGGTGTTTATSTNPGGNNGGSTPTGNYNTNIWWPSNGSTVQGTQPFKAMLEGLDVSQYRMFWQVDGGTLNEMFNSSTDYPHKEALVDVSGWSWNGNGPYTLNFLSQNNSGSTISQKSIQINVAR